MTQNNPVEKHLLSEINIVTAEVNRLMKLSKNEATAEEALDALDNMADTPNTQITTVFPISYFSHEDEIFVEAHAELVIVWKHGVGRNNPILLEVSLVNSTRSTLVEVSVTPDDPETANMWLFANSQIMYVMESGDYRSHVE